MAWRHAPFDKKKQNVAPCIADVPFFISSSEKNADCRQKEKKKGGDEKGRSSLMPKPNEILQQVYKMFHPP
jgi:hypothetical protein